MIYSVWVAFLFFFINMNFLFLYLREDSVTVYRKRTLLSMQNIFQEWDSIHFAFFLDFYGRAVL